MSAGTAHDTAAAADVVDTETSVLVVEHHHAVMADADRIVDLGTPAALVAARSTPTGQHLAAYAGAGPITRADAGT